MSYDYYIINHTKKERVHFNQTTGRKSIETNPKAVAAYLSYLLWCHDDNLKIFQDDGDYAEEYKNVDLSKPNDYEPLYKQDI